ncbi:MAG: Sir2 family NAD-dependent protein deacetylase [Myxococcales bacterium]|nr:NAD-dependent protein deacetylase [Myxococcota bacterium]MDW8283801.1 Sir2 family NAD-dependent protein deacetylase [Myxococcales bacterium]
MDHSDAIRRAAAALSEADALLVGAGAGMGVDSGLPDFRGDRGFWRAYPVCERLGLNFASMANPRWFVTDPAFAWGFYGHRLNLYRRTRPHAGFRLLLDWAARKRHGLFVFTSNVDGQFQRAGVPPERVVEVHGSIHHLQCLRSCGVGIVPADGFNVEVDEETLRARPPLPTCSACLGVLRPNILMFGDATWDDGRTIDQEQRLEAWLHEVPRGRLVVLECGAGTAVPSVRHFCEGVAEARQATLVRINPHEPEVPAGAIAIPLGALEALTLIDRAMRHDLAA